MGGAVEFSVFCILIKTSQLVHKNLMDVSVCGAVVDMSETRMECNKIRKMLDVCS